MANVLYPKFKEFMLAALASGTVKVQLIDTSAYTYSAAHEFLSDVPAGARVGAAVTLTGKSVVDGVFDAADPAFSGLVAAPSIEALLIYIDTGVEATSRVVNYRDADTGLPISAGATGGTVVWSNGANKIFAV